MALVKIPIDPLRANYSMKLDLDGVTYTLSFRYNTRFAFWSMDIADAGETMILSSIPLLLGTIFLNKFPNSNIPQGELFMLNLENENEEATRDNFGIDALLMYEEAI
jgi:hypothetical protein